MADFERSEKLETISIRVKELRNRLGMSQVEFAKNLGVTNAHISKIEKGGTVPSDTLIKLIAKEYGVDEKWLKTGERPSF
jgi:transcriptional regulator with XRE-family HTH domain